MKEDASRCVIRGRDIQPRD